MSTADFLNSLRDQGVWIALAGGMLRCSAPKGVLTPDLRAQIASHRADIEAALGTSAASGKKEQRNVRDTEWQRIRLDSGPEHGHIACFLHCRGHLDERKLQICLTGLVQGQEALRLRFVTVDSSLRASVAAPKRVELPIIDLRDVRPGDVARFGAVRNCTATQCDLARGPLMRCVLFRLSPDERILRIVLPEIAVDSASIPILMRHLARLYSGGTQQELAARGPILHLFSEPAEIGPDDYDYWRRLLRALPRWRLREGGPSAHAVIRPVQCADADDRIQDSAFAAAFAVLLSQYSGETDVAIAISGLGRPSELADVAGPFTPVALLRVNLADDPTGAELLTRVDKQLRDALEHRSLSLPSAISRLAADRQIGHVPLFRYRIDFEGEASGVVVLDGFDADWQRSRDRTWEAGPGISISIARKPLQIAIRFGPGCLLAQFGSSYEAILRWLLASPDMRLSGAPLLQESQPADEAACPACGVVAADTGSAITPHNVRLDLHEIEVCLRQNNNVKEAVAVLLNQQSVVHKAAYVTLVKPLENAEGLLLRWLAGRLPARLLPFGVVVLDHMPRTAAGDLDWNAFPLPARAVPRLDMPRTELERLIASAWQDVLGPQPVGLRQQFFESGGSSLLLPQLHEALQRLLNRKFSILELFTYSTIEAQAAYFANSSPEALEVPEPRPVAVHT